MARPRLLGRRRLLQVTAAGAVALTAAPGRGRAQLGAVRWVSPRGTVEVLDDYPYWIARRFGYLGDLYTVLDPGPMEAMATVKLVDQEQADMGYPSPGVLATALEQGMPLVSVWHMAAHDIFGFAFRRGQKPASPAGLAGRTILLGSMGWKSICDPELAQLGIDPGSVQYVEAGPQWGQALLQGRGDAALSWEGLRAQWTGQGLDFDYLLPYEFSRLPANSFVIRRGELQDPGRRAVYERYLRGWAMGLEFGEHNPRAAAQIVMEQFPELAGTLRPAIATESVMQLAKVFRGPWGTRQGWGSHDMAQWQLFFDLVQRIGQISKPIRAEEVCRNDYVAAANTFDAARVQADAEAFVLAPDYQAVDVGAILGRL